MAILPTHRDVSASRSDLQAASSAASTQVANEQTEKSRRPPSESSDENKDDDEGYQDKGIIEVEDIGVKRKVRVVLEQKSGKEMLKEVAGGQYTTPRW